MQASQPHTQILPLLRIKQLARASLAASFIKIQLTFDSPQVKAKFKSRMHLSLHMTMQSVIIASSCVARQGEILCDQTLQIDIFTSNSQGLICLPQLGHQLCMRLLWCCFCNTQLCPLQCVAVRSLRIRLACRNGWYFGPGSCISHLPGNTSSDWHIMHAYVPS